MSAKLYLSQVSNSFCPWRENLGFVNARFMQEILRLKARIYYVQVHRPLIPGRHFTKLPYPRERSDFVKKSLQIDIDFQLHTILS